MIKKYKKQLMISSIVILLPILVGLILWNTLPDRFATHWGIDGTADGWGSKVFAVFALPLMMLATHWLCFWVTTLDPKAKNQTKKAFGMIFWICPVLSVAESAMIYALALGAEFNITSFLMPGFSLLFIGIGNYLPKCKQNYTMGIKVPWALHNDENWNATHRFGGKVWVVGGIIMLVLSFMPADWAMGLLVLLILVMTFVPTLYSWWYYKKQLRSGNASPVEKQKNDKTTKIALIFTAVVLIIVGFILFSGSIAVVYNEDSFTIDASYWEDLTVSYADIEALEYRDGNVDGVRTWGFGSWKLLLGAFKNDEFGRYTRYTYYKPDACVVLTVDGKALVLSGKTAADTEAIYNELVNRVYQ